MSGSIRETHRGIIMETHANVLQVSRELNTRNGNPRWMLLIGNKPGTAECFYTPCNANWVQAHDWHAFVGRRVKVDHRLVRGKHTIERIRICL